jgi:transposase-like protein
MRASSAIQELDTRGGESPQMKYSNAFKARMVQKMTGPNGKSAAALAQEVGICQPTLSRWLRHAAATVQPMHRQQGEQTNTTPARRPQDFTAQEKLTVLVEAASLSEHELGALLRRKGLHQAQLAEWRQAALEGLASDRRRAKKPAEHRRIRELEKELLRKDKALAEAAALLVLKKKASALWGDGDDDTDPRSAR